MTVKEYLECGLLTALTKFYEDDEYGLDFAGVRVEEDSDGDFKATVFAEEDYEGLEKLCNLLNPVVQKVNEDSYFEPECPGRASAWVRVRK